MARDRETPCKFYISKGECTKKRKAEHYGHCQKCDKYVPKERVRHLNKKKEYLDKLKRREKY